MSKNKRKKVLTLLIALIAVVALWVVIAIFTKEKPSDEGGKAPSNDISQDVEDEEDKQNAEEGDTNASGEQDGLVSKPAGSGENESGNYDGLFGNGDSTTSEKDDDNDKDENTNGTENGGETEEPDKSDEPENLDKYWSPMY